MSAYTKEAHDILGGKAQILRVAQSGDVWQVRIWISEEGKYLRKSLRTRDYDAAVERAEKLYLDTYAAITSGKKLFGITLGDLGSRLIQIQ